MLERSGVAKSITVQYEEENFKHTFLFYNNIVKYIKQNISSVWQIKIIKKEKFVGICRNFPKSVIIICEKWLLLKKFEHTV